MDKGTKGQKDKGTKGQCDKGTQGKRGKGTKGQWDKGTKGLDTKMTYIGQRQLKLHGQILTLHVKNHQDEFLRQKHKLNATDSQCL